MKLSGKSRDVDSFVDQLKEEGETVAAVPTANNASAKSMPVSLDPTVIREA